MSSLCRLLRTKFDDMHPCQPGGANHTMRISPLAAPSVWISDLPCYLIHTRRADVHHCGSIVAIHGSHFPTCCQPGRLNACLVASSSLLPVKLHESRLSCRSRTGPRALAALQILHALGQCKATSESRQGVCERLLSSKINILQLNPALTKDASSTQSWWRFKDGIGPAKRFEWAEKKNNPGAVANSWGRVPCNLFPWRVRTFNFGSSKSLPGTSPVKALRCRVKTSKDLSWLKHGGMTLRALPCK